MEREDEGDGENLKNGMKEESLKEEKKRNEQEK